VPHSPNAGLEDRAGRVLVEAGVLDAAGVLDVD
jgi:hypothetical protein